MFEPIFEIQSKTDFHFIKILCENLLKGKKAIIYPDSGTIDSDARDLPRIFKEKLGNEFEASIDIRAPLDLVFLSIESDELGYKMVQTIHDYDKWSYDFYYWNGTTLFWSRD